MLDSSIFCGRIGPAIRAICYCSAGTGYWGRRTVDDAGLAQTDTCAARIPCSPQNVKLDTGSATDNVHAGVLYLQHLLQQTGGDESAAIAGYYQGLGSVQSRGLFDDTQKYVVTSTLTDTSAWQNSMVLGPYDPERIRKLKEEIGDLYVSGSATLVRTMLADGLVDELNLCVYPVTRGGGPRLWPEGMAPATWDRKDAQVYDNGVMYLAYRPKNDQQG